jgi:hypothetical protein
VLRAKTCTGLTMWRREFAARPQRLPSDDSAGRQTPAQHHACHQFHCLFSALLSVWRNVLRDASHASHNRLRNVSHNRPNASHDAGWLHEQRSSSTHRLSAFYLCCLLTLVPYIPTCSSSKITGSHSH